MSNISGPGPEQRIYRPAELNQEARVHLEAGFPRLWLRGELSNLARPASGHWYFTIKDERAQIRCALFRGQAGRLNFRPANGDEVLVLARVSLYEPRGEFQLIVDTMLPAGAGALQLAFEATRRRLESEGLLDPERKQSLPAWPRRIGIITSPTGAAIRDILHVLERRWPSAVVRIYPAQVQGEAAPKALIRALEAAERHDFADVLILARGGGSLEDLWAFNDEALARRIARLKMPVISGVGHETDVTIADLVADRRAPTPTAAAVMATPDGPSLGRQLGQLDQRLYSAIGRNLDRHAQTVDYLGRRLLPHHPSRRVSDLGQRLATSNARLVRTMKQRLDSDSRRLVQLELRLRSQHPGTSLGRLDQHHRDLQARLERAVNGRLERASSALAALARALNAVSPLAVLERGYAVVTGADGQALSRREQFSVGQPLEILLHGFRVRSVVDAEPEDFRLDTDRQKPQ